MQNISNKLVFFTFLLIILFLQQILNATIQTQERVEESIEKKISIDYDGQSFTFYDNINSETINMIAHELIRNDYNLSNYKFAANDTILDLGAHVGIISIILAKKNPTIRIYAIEACPQNFMYLVKNIIINKIANIIPINMAVTDKTGELALLYDVGTSQANSGGSTLELPKNTLVNPITKTWHVPTISLDDLFTLCDIQHCALMKIDCEGSEYKILFSSEKFKTKIVHHLIGEFHGSEYLDQQNYTHHNLYHYCKEYVTGEICLTHGGILNA